MGRPCSLPLAVLALSFAVRPAVAQVRASEEVARAHTMLQLIRDDLHKYYYDSTFGGTGFEARYRHVDSSLNTIATNYELFGAIAQFLMDLHDSHTRFLPPALADEIDYGWGWGVIGDRCYVRWVHAGSDAEQAGVAVGDEVLSIDGLALNRSSNELMGYIYNELAPKQGLHLQLRKPDGRVVTLNAMAKVTPHDRLVDMRSVVSRERYNARWRRADTVTVHTWREFGDTVLVWHLGEFVFDDHKIDDMMKRARLHKALILDLRDNPGGAVKTLERLLGHFVGHRERVALAHRRNQTDTVVAEPVGRTPFQGNLIVLVNAGSASAAEITARFLQLEGLSTTVGDRSAGAVMESRIFTHVVGDRTVVVFAATVTVDDLTMDDGARLENVGVEPEFIIVPTAADLAAGRDPQMTKALALAGIQLDPVQAAKIYSKDFARAP
jgi:C-terminal processing protease CtpA/Prc